MTSFPWVLISLEMKIIFHKLGFLTCRLAASWTICGQGLSLDSFSQMSFDDPGSQQFSDSATAETAMHAQILLWTFSFSGNIKGRVNNANPKYSGK